MIIERIIYNIIAILLLAYVIKLYVDKKKEWYLGIAAGEVIAIVFNILNLFNSVYYGNYLLEMISAVFGIIIPGLLFLSRYFSSLRNNIVGLLGAGSGIFEKGTVNEYYEKIPMIESKDPNDVVKWIKLNEEDVVTQIKEKFANAENLATKEKYKEALDIYNSAESLFNENPVILFNSGVIYMRNANYEMAVARFLRASELLENQETYDDSSASIAFDRAKNIMQGIEKFDVYYNLALAFACWNKPELAVENFKKAGEVKSNWILVYKPLAIILENLKRYEEAAKMYEKLSEYEPEDFAGYGKIGTLFAFRKEYDKAIMNYRKAIRQDPNNASLYYNMGILLYETDKITEAINTFRNAIEINADDYRFHYNLALALERADEKALAIDELRKTLILKPDYTVASNMLAILYCGTKNQEAAIQVCESAIKYDIENYELYFNAAIAYMEIKDYENAKKYFVSALSKNPNLAEAYFGLGQIAVITEDYYGAETNYLKAIKANPDYPNPYYNLSRIYANRKEYAKVMENLTEAVRLNPAYKQRIKNDGAFDFMQNMNDFKALIGEEK